MISSKKSVFISYSRHDYMDEAKNVIPGNPVSKVLTALDEAGIDYWFDKEGILHGEDFAEKILVNIENADVFVFLSSVHANASNWTRKEVACAHELGKHIISVRLDDSPYNKSIMVRLVDLDYIEYYKNPVVAVTELVESIKAVLKGTSLKQRIINGRPQRDKKIEEKGVTPVKETIAEVSSPSSILHSSYAPHSSISFIPLREYCRRFHPFRKLTKLAWAWLAAVILAIGMTVIGESIQYSVRIPDIVLILYYILMGVCGIYFYASSIMAIILMILIGSKSIENRPDPTVLIRNRRGKYGIWRPAHIPTSCNYTDAYYSGKNFIILRNKYNRLLVYHIPQHKFLNKIITFESVVDEGRYLKCFLEGKEYCRYFQDGYTQYQS